VIPAPFPTGMRRLCLTALILPLLGACAGAKADSASTAAAKATPTATPAKASGDSGIPAGLPADSALRTAADLGRIHGAESAKVWLLVVSDFECPYCKQWHLDAHATVVKEFVDAGKLRIAYVNFPLPNHAHALPAAEAAMCASAQGKYVKYADALFESQSRWHELPSTDATAVFAELATSVGLDLGPWTECTTSGAMRPLVLGDRERARQIGVGSTPTFIIGQTRIPGVMPLGEFRKVIEDEIAKAAQAPAR
jgi:protein-disulfide isomerase